MIYAEYVRIIERRDNMLDGSFKDFRLYSVLGYFFVIVGTIIKLVVKYIVKKLVNSFMVYVIN